MPGAEWYLPQQFLGLLNKHARVIYPGTIEPRSPDEPAGNCRLELRPHVDLVICGPCAGPGLASVQDVLFYNEAHPMGRTPGVGGGIRASWLHEVMNSLNPGCTLVYARCCGTYPETYRDMLCRLFPRTSFLFPAVRNLGDLGTSVLHDLAQDLVSANILAIAKTDPPLQD